MKYFDSNFFIYAVLDRGKKGKWARDLIKEIESGSESAVTSTLTYDEFYWKVNREKGFEVALEATEALLEMPNLRFLEVDDEVIWKSFELIKNLKLDPRDSIHAACALLRGVYTMVSEDMDFDGIGELNRVWM
jgi:predicted nucleic acid-binding protein